MVTTTYSFPEIPVVRMCKLFLCHCSAVHVKFIKNCESIIEYPEGTNCPRMDFF